MGRRNKSKKKKTASSNDPITTAKEKQIERKQKERDIAKKFAQDQAIESALILMNQAESSPSQSQQNLTNRKRKFQNDGAEAIHTPLSEMIRAKLQNNQEVDKKQKKKKGKAKALKEIILSTQSNTTADVMPDEMLEFSFYPERTATPKKRQNTNVFEELLSSENPAETTHNGTNGWSVQKPSVKRKRIASSSASGSDSSALSLDEIANKSNKKAKKKDDSSIMSLDEIATKANKKANKKLDYEDIEDEELLSDEEEGFENPSKLGWTPSSYLFEYERSDPENLGDDLEDEHLQEHDADELDIIEDEEDSTLDGFITNEIEESMDDEEEDDVYSDGSDYSDTISISSDVQLDILGYRVFSDTPLCVVLKAEEGYTTAAQPFSLYQFSSDNPLEDSVSVGLKALHWILKPIDSQTFFSEVFQKRAMVINRATSNYYAGFFSTEDFVNALKENIVEYGKNVNIASYVNGVRHTHNHPLSLTTASLSSTVERFNGYQLKEHLALKRSAQCINPQAFSDNILYLCEILQEVFCSFVGANNYLTPANSAGFAPHWDDVDTFMLQTEGRKHWKVYAPESKDAHPLNSSENFNDDDFKGRKPVFDGWLEQGDLLYLPRGFTHQAHTDSKLHSHHVTVSVCRKFAFSDFFDTVVPTFIKDVSSFSTKLRLSLPPLLLDMTGVASVEYTNAEALNEKLLPVADRFCSMMNSKFHAFLPSFVDLMAKEFMRTALPPLLTPFERHHCCLAEANVLVKPKKFKANVEVRLIRKHAQRLLYETEEHLFIVHRMANSREKENATESQFDLPNHLEACFVKLVNEYPKWTRLSELDSHLETAVELSELLYARCLILKRKASE